MFECSRFLASSHAWAWPAGHIQTCTRCGRQRKALIDLTPVARFNVPRFTPHVMTETAIDREWQREASEVADLERLMER